ncbi:MAG: UDP-glucose/GDP-mannose dehydrogenase family protein [Propionibacteriaceae bacterium]|jgi:UDPglucose 6-dehydrogenase|nr:UDP-glucose/GDP-mannose dehydrogenase family protein [Propionibacteriaceae bacterium]
MRLAIVGCGYLGAVHAAAMASLGHEVVGIDVDRAKVESLSQGRAPFHEPGFPELLAQVQGDGRLRFTTELAAAREAELSFVCVGTPQAPDSQAADLSFVDAALGGLLDLLVDPADRTVVVGKSTVPVGTAAVWAERFAALPGAVDLVWNPEFLREGFAVQDTLSPDRIVYGLPPGESGRRAASALDEVYADLLAAGVPKIETDLATAELVKVAANAFLATKISFINAMAEVCEAAGGDIYELAQAIGLDPRIGRRFLRPGVGFGGGCLPKDIRAFAARARELGAGEAVEFLGAVDRTNLRARRRMADLVTRAVAGKAEAGLEGYRVAVLGAAFKPDSDDMRDSPALAVARELARRGAEVVVYDPAAGPMVRQLAPELQVAQSLSQAATGAGALVVLTEWDEFVQLDPDAVAGLVARRLVVDGRGALDPGRWTAAGWDFHRLGAPSPLAAKAVD